MLAGVCDTTCGGESFFAYQVPGRSAEVVDGLHDVEVVAPVLLAGAAGRGVSCEYAGDERQKGDEEEETHFSCSRSDL